MNEYRIIFETDMKHHITIRETWDISAISKSEAIDRVLSVHSSSKVITARKLPRKKGT